MVGIFSRLSGGRSGHRRTQSAIDGRIWKERMSANARARSELPIVKESSDHETEATGSRTRSGSARRVILPSHSAPEHNLINLLEEYNAA
ncbi:hypothetical protein Taro_029994 [Colocasia esculenta]|uniref:Uncharacterized protein n=1 Tax=Colocasia esculenta TaxID=4460 RepID=A0A843VST6_COLES|nr:hypothetical protein [Colocasia esculenta]